MRNFLRSLILFLMIFLTAGLQKLQAQKFAHGGEYLSYISAQYSEIQKDMLSYTSAVAHGKSARKVETRRKELLETNLEAKKKIAALAPFEGDKSLRDSSVAFLDMSYHVLNDDYGKIVNMEEVAEQSYDAMEAYLLAQDLASDKLNEAGKMVSATEKTFAAAHNVTLLEGSDDDVDKKMKIASKVNSYHRVIYLIFFKSYKQELYLLDAINKKDVSGIEQSKNSLIRFSGEGLAKLDTMKAYDGDNSMILSCKQMLNFYKKECDKIPVANNYIIKEENFQKVKKAYDAKKESERTQADVDAFNKAVNDMNASVNEFNSNNNQMNTNRAKVLDDYNKKSSGFLDRYTPKYK